MSKPASVHLDDERTRPDSPDVVSFQHHLARYQFASGLLTGSERILDAGCGTGYGPDLLSRKCAGVVGVDYSFPAIQYAREHFQRGNLHFAQMDCCRLALDAAQFDAVISFEIFEHLEDPAKYLAECLRVLRPGGLMILSTPNRAAWEIHMRSIGQVYEFHVNMVNLPELRAWLEPRFASVEMWGQRRKGNWLYTAVRALDVFNLRLRLVSPAKREQVQQRLGVETGAAITSNAWVFQQRQLRQCNHLVAVCRKAG